MKIYNSQNDLTIRLETAKDLTGSTAEIHYQKPSGVKGYFPAIITDETKGIIQYSLTDASLNEIGEWKFWAKTTNPTGLKSIGESVVMNVSREGY